ncbi:MAG: mobile mystery protein A [Alphaproteobacteria bacterium]
MTMSGVKDTAIRQYARLLDRAAQQLAELKAPKEGWIAIMRKALGMSAPELARRMGVTKAAIYQAERKERDGGVTLQHMEKLAKALGGRFVYAIVPESSMENVLRTQARKKAESIIRRASAHMALEKQSLTPAQTSEEIERLADELLRDRPSDFWELR